MNKRGNALTVLLLTGFIVIVLFVAVLISFGIATLNDVTEVVVPEFSNLGMIGDWNATETTEYTLAPVQSVINSFNWMGGVAFILAILAMFGFAYGFRDSSEKWVIPLFVALMFLVIIIAIFMSNIYEGFYTGTDDIATGLQDQGLLSYLILYSPTILAICGFIAGAILFSGGNEQTA